MPAWPAVLPRIRASAFGPRDPRKKPASTSRVSPQASGGLKDASDDHSVRIDDVVIVIALSARRDLLQLFEIEGGWVADEQDRRDFETERPGGSQIDHQFEQQQYQQQVQAKEISWV